MVNGMLYLQKETGDLSTEFTTSIWISRGEYEVIRRDSVVGDTLAAADHPDDDIGDAVLRL